MCKHQHYQHQSSNKGNKVKLDLRQFILFVLMLLLFNVVISLKLMPAPTLRQHTYDDTDDTATTDAKTSSSSSYDGIFVISLDNNPEASSHNHGRFNDFKTKLSKSCTSAGYSAPHIELCPGVYDSRRGYGLTLSWLACLEKAQAMDLEVTVVLEDDARLFDRAESLMFCNDEMRQQYIWEGMPKDTFLAFLGGHSWEYADGNSKPQHHHGDDADHAGIIHAQKKKPTKINYRETSMSYGTYGFAIPHQSLEILLHTIRSDLDHGWFDKERGEFRTKVLSPEKSWYGMAERLGDSKTNGYKMYALDPLVVWHEGGFSNTWNRERSSITGEEEDDVSGQHIRGAMIGSGDHVMKNKKGSGTDDLLSQLGLSAAAREHFRENKKKGSSHDLSSVNERQGMMSHADIDIINRIKKMEKGEVQKINYWGSQITVSKAELNVG